MSQLGTVPAANRYSGLGAGSRFAYLFETQVGIPVDGTSERLRDLSPFTLRLVPPEALLAVAARQNAQFSEIDLIQAAALGSDTGTLTTTVANALSTVSVLGTVQTSQLEAFVASGQFFTGRDLSSGFVSTLADAFTAGDIALQLRRLLDVPPLTLLINPSSMNTSYTKLQSYQTRTRFGYVFEAWGEEQPTISFSGSTAGFVAGAADVSNPFGAQQAGTASSVTGYQEAARRDSAAWQNFSSLYHFYRNNGYIYDTIGKSEAHLFVGAIAIDYDQWTYVGHIESFSYKFDSSSPHRVTFDMDFKVAERHDRARASTTVLPQNSPTVTGTSPAGAQRTGTSLGLGSALASLRTSEVEQSQSPVDLLGGF